MAGLTSKEAWEMAEGLIQVDGLSVSEDMDKFMKQELNGEITMDEVYKRLYNKYTIVSDKEE